VGFTQQGAGQSDWEKVKKQEWILLFDPSNKVLENQNLTLGVFFSVLAVAEAKRNSCLLLCSDTRCYSLLTLISHADPLSIFVSTAFTFQYRDGPSCRTSTSTSTYAPTTLGFSN
jgi:hypothetical protein